MKLRKYFLIIIAGLLVMAVSSGFLMAKSPRERESDKATHARHTFEILSPKVLNIKVSKTEAIKEIERIGYKPNNPNFDLIRDHARNKVYWLISWTEEENTLFFEIDAFSGEILGLSDFRYESKPERVSLENVVETAKKRIKEISRFPAEAVEPEVRIIRENEKFFYHVFWSQKIRGIPVKYGFVSITLDPAGNIRQFKKYWQNIVIDTEPKITGKQAIEIAKQKASLINLPEFLKDRIQRAENIYANLVIKKPFHPLDKSKPLYGEYKLIWEVIFESSEEGKKPTTAWVELSIDAHSGELIGMNFTK